MSKKITLSADEKTATVVDAEATDIISTVFSSDETLTGTYGFVQRGLLVIAGMSIQNNRKGLGWNPFA